MTAGGAFKACRNHLPQVALAWVELLLVNGTAAVLAVLVAIEVMDEATDLHAGLRLLSYGMLLYATAAVLIPMQHQVFIRTYQAVSQCPRCRPAREDGDHARQ